MKNNNTCHKDDDSIVDDILEKYVEVFTTKIYNNCIFNFDTDYSKSLYLLYNYPLIPKYKALIEYQNEELVHNDENTFTAIYLPFATYVSIKFYSEQLSPGIRLWYQDIAPFLLSQRVMPNIDILIELGYVNLKYDSRFAKYLGRPNGTYPKQINYISTPEMGKTLHQLIDAELLSEADIFEICKQVDVSVDIYTRIGLSHGNLICDNVKIINLNRIYNYKVDNMLISTNYLAIPSNFHNMFVVKDSILCSLLKDKNQYDIRYDSLGRYDYTTFYLSLLLCLLLNKTKKYDRLKHYIIYMILMPLNIINSKYDFKLTTIFDVKSLEFTTLPVDKSFQEIPLRTLPDNIPFIIDNIKHRVFNPQEKGFPLSKILALVSFGKTLLSFPAKENELNMAGNEINGISDTIKEINPNTFKNKTLSDIISEYRASYEYREQDDGREKGEFYDITTIIEIANVISMKRSVKLLTEDIREKLKNTVALAVGLLKICILEASKKFPENHDLYDVFNTKIVNLLLKIQLEFESSILSVYLIDNLNDYLIYLRSIQVLMGSPREIIGYNVDDSNVDEILDILWKYFVFLRIKTPTAYDIKKVSTHRHDLIDIFLHGNVCGIISREKVSSFITTTLHAMKNISRPYEDNLIDFFVINIKIYLAITALNNCNISKDDIENITARLENHLGQIRKLELGKNILTKIIIGSVSIYAGKKLYDYSTSSKIPKTFESPNVELNITGTVDMNAMNAKICNILTELRKNMEYYNMLPTISSKYDPANIITMEYIHNNNEINDIHDIFVENNTSFDTYGLR